jgi:hypothetical protein
LIGLQKVPEESKQTCRDWAELSKTQYVDQIDSGLWIRYFQFAAVMVNLSFIDIHTSFFFLLLVVLLVTLVLYTLNTLHPKNFNISAVVCGI